jgi:phage-related protein
MAKIARPLRPVLWIASARRDYQAFPSRVQSNLGFELFLVQTGQHPPSGKPLKGFGSGKKKSKQGNKTPQSDIDRIKRRLRAAEADYALRFKESKP